MTCQSFPGIPSPLPQACSLEIAPSICELFNHYFHTSHIPSEWKSANITPVHKKERKEVAENYRPISLLPILSKVLEWCVCLRLYSYIEHFITQSVITTWLFKTTTMHHTTPFCSAHHRTIALQKIQTDIIYLDFAKAFDSVDHQLLLQKLKSYGVREKLYNWFANYLSGRCQTVVLGARNIWCVARKYPWTCSFVIFINNLPYILENGSLVCGRHPRVQFHYIVS